MAVYFDHRLETAPGTINTDLSWFSGAPLLAVTSYGEENGGFVTLYNEVPITFYLVKAKQTLI